MATSTFSKQFAVKPEKAEEFVKEMTKTVTPTLHSDFQPELIHLTKENEWKDTLSKVLSK